MFSRLAILALFFAIATASVSLGPVKSCRCYSHSALPPSMHAPLNLGPAEICHCMSPFRPAMQPAYPVMAPAHPVMAPVRMSRPSFLSSFMSRGTTATSSCPSGPAISGKYTVDDTSKMFICGTNGPVSFSSLNQLTPLDLPAGPCSNFLIELRNDQFSSGVAFEITVGGTQYVAKADDAPNPPAGVKTLQAWAAWTYGDCTGFQPSNSNRAKYVSTLEGTNQQFITLSSRGAHPLGAQNGNGYQNGLQCVVIENPFCSS